MKPNRIRLLWITNTITHVEQLNKDSNKLMEYFNDQTSSVHSSQVVTSEEGTCPSWFQKWPSTPLPSLPSVTMVVNIKGTPHSKKIFREQTTKYSLLPTILIHPSISMSLERVLPSNCLFWEAELLHINKRSMHPWTTPKPADWIGRWSCYQLCSNINTFPASMRLYMWPVHVLWSAPTVLPACCDGFLPPFSWTMDTQLPASTHFTRWPAARFSLQGWGNSPNKPSQSQMAINFQSCLKIFTANLGQSELPFYFPISKFQISTHLCCSCILIESEPINCLFENLQSKLPFFPNSRTFSEYLIRTKFLNCHFNWKLPSSSNFDLSLHNA